MLLAETAPRFSNNREYSIASDFEGVWGASNITAEEYCNFLNTVAASDSHHLYDEKLEVETLITHSGSPGHYRYAVTSENKDHSVLYINPLSAMRYCNWLQNGSGSIDEGLSITEHRTYEVNNDQLVSVNSDAAYFIADEDAPLSLNNYNDKQLYSSCSNFHVVTALSLDSNKSSGRGKTGTSIQKIEE